MKEFEVSKNNESVKANKKLRIFLLFLLLSFLFWMLIKLSKDYIAEVNFDLDYIEVPKNKLIQNKPDSRISLTVKTIGFKLLKYKFNRKKLNYSLSDIQRKKGSEYYSITKNNLKHLQAQFSVETEVLKINTDTLYFDLGIEKTKKIKVIPHLNLTFKPGFNLIDNYTIEPEFISVSGPEKLVDSVSEIHTEILELKDVAEDFIHQIDLINSTKSISLSLDHVSIKGQVEKITEGSYMLSYNVINLPKGVIISTYPKEIKVVYQVALKDYNKITANSFTVQCDYSETVENKLDYFIPVIVEKPNILFDVKIVPNKIEFLIKK